MVFWLKVLKMSLFQFRNEENDLEVWTSVLALSLNLSLTLRRASVATVSEGLLLYLYLSTA